MQLLDREQLHIEMAAWQPPADEPASRLWMWLVAVATVFAGLLALVDMLNRVPAP